MKIAIIGNDIHALLAAYMAKKRGHSIILFGELPFNTRAPYTIFDSKRFGQILTELGINFSSYRIKSGILLRNHIHPFPHALRFFGKDVGSTIRADLYSKTRLVRCETKPSKLSLDLELASTKIALRFEWVEFLERLNDGLSTSRKRMVELKSHSVICDDGSVEAFDLCLVTSPLWRCQDFVEWPLPHACAVALNTAVVDSNSDQEVKEQLSGWDYVWTPYTPDATVHRVYQVDGEYHVQFSGSWLEGQERPALIGDLNFLFPAGWAPTGSFRGEAGFLCPLSEKPIWPKSVLPLGRLAQWDAKATISNTVEELSKVLR
jgi:hypothetical protein